MKLKVRFTCNTKVKEQTEKYIFKVPTNKKCAPCKNHHTTKAFIEATKNGIKDELKTKTQKILSPQTLKDEAQ